MIQPSEFKEIIRKITAPEEGAESAIVIQKALAATPYACSSIERLSGGVSNFTYRGHLSNTLSDGSCSVIIKYIRYLNVIGSVFPDARGEYEHRILQVVGNGLGHPIKSDGFRVRAPLTYGKTPDPRALLIQDFVDTTPIIEFLQPSISGDLPSSFMFMFGRALGTWLASFHAQGSFPLDPETRRMLDRPNNETSDFRRSMNRKGILRVVGNFPHVFEGVEDEFKGYLQEMLDCEVEGAMCVAHGDFSARNILISSLPKDAILQQGVDVVVIDWEAFLYESIYFDLGEFLADMYMLRYFRGIESCTWILKGFAEGYGPLKKDHLGHLAASIAAQTLGCGYVVAEAYTPGDQAEVAEFVRDLVLKAREGDSEWFEKGFYGDIWRNSV